MVRVDRLRLAGATAAALLLDGAAAAQPVSDIAGVDVVIEDVVPADGGEFFLVPFDVGAGVAELELRHALVEAGDGDVLDFGLQDASGAFRGWGGGNVESAIVGERAASRSYVAGPLPAGTWHVVVGKARLSSAAPRYRLEISLRATPTLADDPDVHEQQATAPTLSREARWYAGDLHVHSRDSGDARPDLDEIAAFAQARGLDFVVITDHNTNAQVARLDDAQARHPGLLFVPGVEFTTYAGHAGGIGVTDYVEHKVGLSTTVQQAVDAIHTQRALFSINHPVLDLGDVCIGCAWTHELPTGVDGVEIATGGYRQSGFIFGAGARDFWDRLLDDGGRAAPLGGSDDHRAGVDVEAFGSPIGDPTTLVFADGQSTRALLDGIRCNRTVVLLQGPGDPRVDLQTTPGRDCDTVYVVDDVVLRATVTGGIGFRVRFLKDGYVDGDAHDIDTDPFVVTRRLTDHAEGERWRVEITDDDTPRVVTGHVWLARPRSDETAASCGCRGGADAVPPVCFVLILLVRQHRKRSVAR